MSQKVKILNREVFYKACGSFAIAFFMSLAAFKCFIPLVIDNQSLGTSFDHNCFNKFIDKNKKHLKIHKSCTKKTLFIVGDVHGCLFTFKNLLTKANISCDKDLVILTGDFTNKGPKSKEMIEYVASHQSCILTVMGNHEYKLLEYKKWGKTNTSSADFTLTSEQRQLAWADELKQHHLQFIEKLPYTISIPSFNVIVVHASLNPALPLVEQKKEVILSIKQRKPLLDKNLKIDLLNSTYEINTTRASQNISKSWAASWNRSELVVFGHDSTRGLQLYNNALGLDTGCVYGRSLTGVLITAPHDGEKFKNHKLLSVESLHKKNIRTKKKT